MSIISIFNQKGSSGKTMLSVHLAVAAHQAGCKVAILDLDPQGSATSWKTARGDIAGPVVAKVNDQSLERAVAGAQADGFDFVLIDSPPSVSPVTARIIAAADFVLIPVRPSPFDLAAIPATLKLVGKKPMAFVLSDCPQRAPEIAEIRAQLASRGPVLGQINNWRSFWRALVSGRSVAEFEPAGQPAAEIMAIFEAIKKELK
jgi:chromosome partitioning protein